MVGLRTLITAACLLVGASSLTQAAAAKAPPARTGDPDADAVATFDTRVKEYLTLHRKLESQIPKLSKQATPQEIDKNQRALGALIQSARRGAKQGEFFTPGMESLLRRVFARVFSGEDGKNLLGSVMDENPVDTKLTINERYPDTVPLSTMPAEVLAVLPKLEEDMEYRFVGRRLVLLDAHAHLILDFTDELLPESV